MNRACPCQITCTATPHPLQTDNHQLVLMSLPTAATTGLFPGYKHVNTFGDEDDYEPDSEEVEYVTLDLGAVEPTLVANSSTYRLIVSLHGIKF